MMSLSSGGLFEDVTSKREDQKWREKVMVTAHKSKVLYFIVNHTDPRLFFKEIQFKRTVYLHCFQTKGLCSDQN